jgi:hypothetical protein
MLSKPYTPGGNSKVKSKKAKIEPDLINDILIFKIWRSKVQKLKGIIF